MTDDQPADAPTGAAPPTPAARDLFDRGRRGARRGRAIGAAGDYLGQTMADMLVERLADVRRTFRHALIIGARNAPLIAAVRATGATVTLVECSAALAHATGAQWADEDALPVAPQSFDLVLWPGGMEGVNDVPGALLRARFALVPDGLLLGCFIGEGSFPVLRRNDRGGCGPAGSAHAPANRCAGHGRTGYAMWFCPAGY
ncbi:MAG: hypothetical protein ACKOUM_12670 [Sphingopyxis sp.]